MSLIDRMKYRILPSVKRRVDSELEGIDQLCAPLAEQREEALHEACHATRLEDFEEALAREIHLNSQIWVLVRQYFSIHHRWIEKKPRYWTGRDYPPSYHTESRFNEMTVSQMLSNQRWKLSEGVDS